jgi:chromosome segregation ATPase
MPDENVLSLLPALLREIRDEIRSTRDEIHATNTRIDATNSRLDRMDRRQTEAEMRFGTAIAELIAETRKLHNRIDHVLTGPFGDMVRDHDEWIQHAEPRITALETHAG